MKLSSLKIYGILFGIVILILAAVVIFNKSGAKQPAQNGATSGIPNDDIHKGLKDGTEPMPDKGNVSQAVKHEMDELKKAVDKNPDDTLKMRAYADLLAQSHRLTEAMEIYEKILKIDHRRFDILFTMSYFYNMQGELEKAASVTNRILAIDRKNSQARYNLGIIYAEMGKSAEAKKIWSALAKESPDSEIGKLAAESLKKLQQP